MRFTARRPVVVAALIVLAWFGAIPESPVWASTPSAVVEDELIDVGVEVFDPGIPRSAWQPLGAERILPEVRESEAVFVAVLVVRALQDTGRFGIVRMVPRGSTTVDLVVRGRIHRSSGARLALQFEVTDASGRRWLRRGYVQYAGPQAYLDSFATEVEPFQPLYDQFAADLVKAVERTKVERLEELRQISELRYAARLAPALFGDYLRTKRKGRVVLQRLPAHDDPMLERVRRIGARDELFLDLLTDRYEAFLNEMNRSYNDYRATSHEAEMALRYATVQAYLANLQQVDRFGPPGGHRRRSATLSRRELYFRRQAALQARYLENIADTFAVVVEPLRLELDGEVIRFEGTIEDQYRQWQDLLEKIFEAESGLPIAAQAAPGERFDGQR